MPESLSRLLDLGFVPLSLAPVASQSLRVDPKTFKVSIAWPAMGTLVSVTALGGSAARVDEAVGRAFEEMHRLTGILSRFDPDSPVAVLNDEGRLDQPPRELSRLVSRALAFYRVTGGAFDISVAPLVNLLRERLTGLAPALPSEAELREAATLAGAEDVAVSRREIHFGRSGMAITLDGIAKGFIVDRMARTLERHGVTNYLINAGGDIRVAGGNERREPWTVAVRDPRDDTRPAGKVRLSGGAVATSGSYEISFDPERRFHHIVDARTGRSPNHCVSAPVTAHTAMAADALATSVFVMEPREGLALLESLGGCAGLALLSDGSRLESRTWAMGTSTLDPTSE